MDEQDRPVIGRAANGSRLCALGRAHLPNKEKSGIHIGPVVHIAGEHDGIGVSVVSSRGCIVQSDAVGTLEEPLAGLVTNRGTVDLGYHQGTVEVLDQLGLEGRKTGCFVIEDESVEGVCFRSAPTCDNSAASKSAWLEPVTLATVD